MSEGGGCCMRAESQYVVCYSCIFCERSHINISSVGPFSRGFVQGKQVFDAGCLSASVTK